MQSQSIDDCLRALPKQIKIGAYDWSVVLAEGNGDLHGRADFEVKRIEIWPETLTSVAHGVGIVLHECLHVIFDNHGLEKLKREKEAREEAIIGGFEAGLVALFRDNPKLMKWFQVWLR